MPYATQQDIEDAISTQILTQMTDDNEDGSIDTAVVDRGLAEAAAKIDGALAVHYVVPLSAPYPPIVVAANVWLAVCAIALRRGVMPEDYVSTCEEWKEWLERVRKGEEPIPELQEYNSLPQSTTEQQSRLLVRDRLDNDGNSLNPGETPTIDVW
jgi:phage gp36-like protein